MLEKKPQTLQCLRHIILSNSYSVLLTECIFSKAEIILSRKVIFFNNPACWQMFKREKYLQLFWECSAWYLQVYLFCYGKEWLLVCMWTIQLLMLWKKRAFVLYLGVGALGEVFSKKIVQFLVTIQMSNKQQSAGRTSNEWRRDEHKADVAVAYVQHPLQRYEGSFSVGVVNSCTFK